MLVFFFLAAGKPPPWWPIAILHGGYVLAQADVRPWWIWAWWVDPLQYARAGVSGPVLCAFILGEVAS